MAGITKFIKKICVQDAVYWGNPQSDGTGGFTFDAPRVIKCRWSDKMEKIRDKNGVIFVSVAEVRVMEDLDLDGFLYLGTLKDFNNENRTSPQTIKNAFKISITTKVPLFRSTTEFVRKVYLGNG